MSAEQICEKTMSDYQHLIDNTQFPVSMITFENALIKLLTVNLLEDTVLVSPISISLNNCVGNYLTTNNDVIQKDDIIKIDFTIKTPLEIYAIAKTFSTNDHTPLQLLEKLKKKCLEIAKPGETNDTVRILLETEISNAGYIPVENCISYEINSDPEYEPKYITLNYQKYYDADDNLVGELNECFELLEGEVYTMVISIVNESDVEAGKIIKKINPRMYSANNHFYALKLNSSKKFLNTIKRNHANNKFDIENYTKDTKNKFGFKELCKYGLLTEYPILYTNSKVFTRKFTFVVG